MVDSTMIKYYTAKPLISINVNYNRQVILNLLRIDYLNISEKSPIRNFLSGIWDEVPIFFGVIPFGMIYAFLAQEAGLTIIEGQAMSLIVFAGSSQFLLVQLASIKAPILVIVITGFIINLRHLLYSASIAPHIKNLSTPWKFILSYLLTDEAYAIAIADFQKPSRSYKHWYFFGAGVALWGAWQISTWIGLQIGEQIPPTWSLDFALPLTFIALVVPLIKDRPRLIAAIVSGAVALLTIGFPYKLGLILAAIFGIYVGVKSENS